MKSITTHVHNLAPTICLGLGLVTSAAALELVVPEASFPEARTVAKLLFSLTMVFLAWYDWQTHLVPPPVSLPLLFAGLSVVGFRLVAWHDLTALPFIFGVMVLFAVNLIAGGDAKLAMAFFSFWPGTPMFWALLVAHVAIGVPLLVRKYLRTPVRQLTHGVVAYAFSGRHLPSDQDLAHGDPATLIYAAAGIAYVWLLLH